MKRKILGIVFLAILMLTISMSNSLAYSDDLFEFDLPSSYVNVTYKNMYAFSDSNYDDRGFIINVREDRDMKKSVWEISQSDLNTLVRSLSGSSTIISTDRRAKLGKEKAVEVVLSEGNDYMSLYILASNKYIYMVSFVGNSEEDLENADYAMIKKSFKLKDSTTNFRSLYIFGIIIIAGVSIFFKLRRTQRFFGL